MRISVIGTGYVGLVSGTCLAELGHEVTCVDIDRAKVDAINAGQPPIYEVGLEEMLQRNVGQRLRATDDLASAVANSDLSLIAVGTPFDGQEIDLSYIRQAAAQIGDVLKEKDTYHVVVVKSTVVPGTTDSVVLPVLEEHSGKRAGADFGVGMNPEFLKEGEAIADFMQPDRIVFGGIDDASQDALAELYAIFTDADKLRTNCRTAEMIKYTANSLLATMISFSNEIANLSAAVGDIDVTEVMAGVHLDKRLSPILEQGRIKPSFTTYIEAGCGFGGSCFPKDVKALTAYGSQVGQNMPLLESVIAVNSRQPARMLELLKGELPELAGKTVAVLGYAFKPGTDDIRESPALPITQALLDEGAAVRGFDPIAEHEARKVVGESVQFCADVKSAVADVDAVLIVTRWPEFSDLPNLLPDNNTLVVDGRRMLDKNSVANYVGIGLG